MADENVKVIIEGDATDLRNALRGAATEMRTFGATAGMQGRRVGAMSLVLDQQRRNLQQLASAARFAAIGLAGLGGYTAIKLIKQGIELNASWESAAAGIATFTGSVKSAEKFIERLRKVSAESPLRLTDYIEASRQLMGFGLQAEKVIPLLDAVNKAVVATGGGAEEMQRVVLALGQIQARGKASAEELNQLAEVGVPVNKILQKELGLTGDQIANIGEEGISSGKVLGAIADGWNRQYADAYRNAQDTFNMQTARLGKNFEQVLRLTTEPLFETIEKDWLPVLNDASDQIIAIWDRKGITPAEKFEASFRVLKRKLGPLIDDLGQTLADMDLEEKFADVLDAAIPIIAKGAGKLAWEAAQAFVGAFIHADVWTKLLMGGWLFTKIAGRGGWVALGKALGRKLGIGIATGAAAEVGGGAAGGGLLAALTNPLTAIIVGAGAAGVAIDKLYLKLSGKKTLDETISIYADFAKGVEGLGRAFDEAAKSMDSTGGKLRGVTDDLRNAQRAFERLDEKGITVDPKNNALLIFLDDLRDRFGTLPAAARSMSAKSRAALLDFARAAQRTGAISINQFQMLQQVFAGVSGKIQREAKAAAKVTGENWRDIAEATKGMRVSVSKDYDGMVNAVGGGLHILTQNTQRALAAVGLKQELKWQVTRSDGAGGIQGHPQARGGLVELARGGLARVGGQGLADTVPLYANGVAKAVVAPGEDLAVINRHQRPMLDAAVTAAYGVKGLAGFFREHDRPHYMAAGGIVALGRQLQSEGYEVGENPAFGGVAPVHAPNSYHYSGQAIDVNDDAPPYGYGSSEFASLSHLYNRLKGMAGVIELLWQVPDHYDHLHVAMAEGASGALGGGTGATAMAKHIKRLILHGPAGALTEGGQAALDKLWRQANKFIDEKNDAPGGSDYVSGGNGAVAAQMGRILLKTGWNRSGAAGVIGNAYRESLWNPASVGTGGGGLFGFTTSPVSLADLQSFANQQHKPWTDVGLQMQFMQNHLSGSVKQAVMAAGSPEAAAERFMTLWERPGIPALAERQAAARQAFEMSSWARGGLLPMLASGSPDLPPTNIYGNGTPGGARHPDVGHVLSRLGRADPKTRKKILGNLTDKIHDLYLEPGLQKRINRVSEDIRVFSDNATRAGDLTSFRDDWEQATIGGKTEAEWLEKALPKMATLRNLFITADRHLDKMRAELERQQEKAAEELREIEKKLRALAKEREGLEKKREEDGISKDRREAIDRKLDALDQSERKLNIRRAAIKDTIAPSLKDQVKKIKTKDKAIVGPDGLLEGLQGIDAPMRKMRHLPDRLGLFGGTIYETQKRLYELGHPAATESEAEMAELLRGELQTARLTASLSESQFGTFQGFFDEFRSQMPFVGSFDHGGRIPRTGFARVHRDELIVPDPQGPFVTQTPAGPTEIKVFIEGDVAPLMKRVRAEVDGRTVQVVNQKLGRSVRQLSVAPGR